MKSKFILFLILLFFIKCSNNNNNSLNSTFTIEIEHIGESDKPIKTIIISNNNFKNLDYNSFKILCQINNKSIVLLINELKEYSNNNCNNNLAYEFGSFKVKTYRDSKLINCFILENHSKSIVFFNNILKKTYKIQEEKDLIKSLEYNLQRVKNAYFIHK